MDQDQNSNKEEKAASALKEVYQEMEDKPAEQPDTNKDQPGSEEVAEEIKGSDADMDKNIGTDPQPDAEEQATELEGSDADSDKNV